MEGSSALLRLKVTTHPLHRRRKLRGWGSSVVPPVTISWAGGGAAYDPILPAPPQFVGHLKVGQPWGPISVLLLGQPGGLPEVGGRQAKRGGWTKI